MLATQKSSETTATTASYETNAGQHDIKDLLSDSSRRWLRVAAPMVRYSKLPFRLLVRQYGVDLAYTPMMMADCFARSSVARHHEFQLAVHPFDRPLVAQFAARDAREFGQAAALISPFVDAIDLNCGCPQSWALAEHIGAYLLTARWEVLANMLAEAQLRANHRPISVKIRLLPSLQDTVELVRRLEAAKVAWITVHGRTRYQRSHEPINVDAIRLVREAVTIPVFANGSVNSLADAEALQTATGVRGIMAARGLLANPALFAGQLETPWEAVHTYCRLAIDYGTCLPIFHHHLSTMIESLLPRYHRRHFNTLSSIPAILDFIHDYRDNE